MHCHHSLRKFWPSRAVRYSRFVFNFSARAFESTPPMSTCSKNLQFYLVEKVLIIQPHREAFVKQDTKKGDFKLFLNTQFLFKDTFTYLKGNDMSFLIWKERQWDCFILPPLNSCNGLGRATARSQNLQPGIHLYMATTHHLAHCTLAGKE